jgi:hypothetical protein
LVKTTWLDWKTLTKGDVCLVWGGTDDVGRNETNMNIRALNDFVSSHEHTKIIMQNVPHRHDLAPNSCVNYEVKVFNRKLGRQRKFSRSINHTKALWQIICMYVCRRGGPEIRPLHRDLQWSIVLPLLFSPLLILHFEWNAGLYINGK